MNEWMEIQSKGEREKKLIEQAAANPRGKCYEIEIPIIKKIDIIPLNPIYNDEISMQYIMCSIRQPQTNSIVRTYFATLMAVHMEKNQYV